MNDKPINYMHHQHDFVGWALCELMGDKYKEIMPLPDQPREPEFKVELKLNGIEVDFLAMCKVLEDNYERAVKEAAAELVKDRFARITTALDKIELHVNAVASELGSPWDER